MAKLNMQVGKDYVQPEFQDGIEYTLAFKGLYTSFEEERQGFIDKETGLENQWISFNVQIVDEGVPHLYASKFFVVKRGDEWDAKALKQIDLLYEAATGTEAPAELDTDELFIDLEGKHFVSKVFLVTDKDGNPKLNDRGDKQYQFSPWVKSVTEFEKEKAQALELAANQTYAVDLSGTAPAAATVETSESESPFSDMFK